MFLAENERRNPSVSNPFAVSREGFTYLGIKIMPTIDKIIMANYNPLTEGVIQLINRWTKLQLIGRINILKITILPKTCTSFHRSCFPHLSLSLFQLLNKTFSNFIWNNKWPIVRLSLLYNLLQMQTVDTQYILIQYEWLCRQYILPSRLHHLNSNIPDTCIKHNHHKGTLFHCMWECPQILGFWSPGPIWSYYW